MIYRKEILTFIILFACASANGVEVTNGAAALVDDGTSRPVLSANGCGWALETASGDVADVVLMGKWVNLASS